MDYSELRKRLVLYPDELTEDGDISSFYADFPPSTVRGLINVAEAAERFLNAPRDNARGEWARTSDDLRAALTDLDKGKKVMSDELWTPSDLQVTDLQVTLKYVDVRRPVDRIGKFIPASFRAVATVLVGVNGVGDPIFQTFAANGDSVNDVLGKVWAAARAAQLKRD